jgi:hypothetical protein
VNDRPKPEPGSGEAELRRTPAEAQADDDIPAAPPAGMPTPVSSRPIQPRTRREGSPRQNVSEPVVFHAGSVQIEGWTLNVSRGGLRAVIEDEVAVGAELEVCIGDSDARRPVRVVWAREQRGSAVIGLSFLDQPSEPPPEPLSIETTVDDGVAQPSGPPASPPRKA